MFDAFPQLTRPIGAPKAPTFTKETPYKFSRQFEHLDVTLDCHPEPKCAGYTTEAACDGGLAACEWHARLANQAPDMSGQRLSLDVTSQVCM